MQIAICGNLPTNCWQWYNDWAADVDSWMNNKNLDVYYKAVREGDKRKPHSTIHGNFRTYRFHLSGCVFLLNKLIQLDIVDNDSEDRPAALMQCIKDFAKHKESPEYKKAVEESQQQNKKQRRLSQ